jgi:hypothetical protein
MKKFALFNIGQKQLNKSMRAFFKDLIDDIVEGPAEGYLKSVPSNYGYVFFWYGYPDEKALENHYAKYVSKEESKDIEKARKEDCEFVLREYLEDYVFSMARDHPPIIGSGLAEAHFAILIPDLEKKSLKEAASLLKKYVQKLESLERFRAECLKKRNRHIEDIDASFEVVDFLSLKKLDEIADEEFWECDCDYREFATNRLGCEIVLKIYFEGNSTLEEIVERIDAAVTPLKEAVDQMFRYGESCYPF